MNQPIFELYKDVYGKYKFRLRGTTNKIVAIGGGYKTKSACIEAVNSIKAHYKSPIKDLTIGDTTLILSIPPHRVKKGSRIAFSGRLYGNGFGEGVPRAKINIYENDGSLLKPKQIASGTTNLRGEFDIKWTVKKMDWWDNSIEIFANFEGTSSLKPSISEKHSIYVC
jgi:uncharacterized protein YegP (UPF0339 family)